MPQDQEKSRNNLVTKGEASKQAMTMASAK